MNATRGFVFVSTFLLVFQFLNRSEKIRGVETVDRLSIREVTLKYIEGIIRAPPMEFRLRKARFIMQRQER